MLLENDMENSHAFVVLKQAIFVRFFLAEHVLLFFGASDSSRGRFGPFFNQMLILYLKFSCESAEESGLLLVSSILTKL